MKKEKKTTNKPYSVGVCIGHGYINKKWHKKKSSLGAMTNFLYWKSHVVSSSPTITWLKKIINKNLKNFKEICGLVVLFHFFS